jgi:hypothetical protein
MVVVVPETVQTLSVVEAKATARLADVVELRLNVPVGEYGYEVTVGANVMVCVAFVMVKLTGTGVAAA